MPLPYFASAHQRPRPRRGRAEEVTCGHAVEAAEAGRRSRHVAETTQGRSGSAARQVRGDFKCGAAAGEVTRRRWWLLSRLASEAQAEASLARLLRRAARGRGGGESTIKPKSAETSASESWLNEFAHVRVLLQVVAFFPS